MNTSFRWCFIGAGNQAKLVARQLKKTPAHEIVSVYTRRQENAIAFVEKYGGKVYSTALEAISAANVDAVYVVTPHTSHYEYSKLALTLGKPVLCEKPITVSAWQAEELFALAKEKNVYLCEGMWTWFSPVANQVRAWVDSGKLGEIVDVVANYHLNSQLYSKRAMNPHLAGGALLNVGIYPITYLYRLFGKPTHISCIGTIRNGVDAYENIDLTFANGHTYKVSASNVDFKGLENMVITGTKGTINAPFFHATNTVKLSVAGEKSTKFKGNGSFLNEFDIVASEIREGLIESRYVPSAATIDVMHIMDECRKLMGLRYPFEK